MGHHHRYAQGILESKNDQPMHFYISPYGEKWFSLTIFENYSKNK